MKRTLVVLIASLALLFTTPVMAGNQNANDNFMSPTQQQTANGNGVNVGGDYNAGGNIEGGVLAEGGNASANNNNMIGNTLIGDTFSPKASVGDITNRTDVDVDVENKNTNLNTNLNSNKNEQEQTQVQGQAQIQGQSQNTKQANKQETNIKFEAEEYKRSLPNAGSGRAFVAQGSDHMESASPTSNYGTVDELVAIQKSFTLGQLMVLSGDNGDIDLDIRAFSSHRVALGNPAKGLKGMDMDTKITFVTSKPSGAAVGLFLGKGDTETDGMSVLAHVGIEAIRHGATTIYVTRNDFVKVLEGSSWGIMVGGGGSTIINDGGTNSSGASIAPGIGYGAVRSAYGLEPSVRAYGFK